MIVFTLLLDLRILTIFVVNQKKQLYFSCETNLFHICISIILSNGIHFFGDLLICLNTIPVTGSKIEMHGYPFEGPSIPIDMLYLLRFARLFK